MPPGFLAVLTTPGPELPLEEFQDWYDNEHIPFRMNNLASFLSGARYRASDFDSQPVVQSDLDKPRWLAMYEIDDTSTFVKPEYTQLREKRSERESGVMKRMGILVRICAEVVKVWKNESSTTKATSGLNLPFPSQWIVTTGLQLGVGDSGKEVEALAIAEEIVQRIEQSVRGGWIRSRILKVVEGGVAGVWKTGEEKVDEYWLVHEFDHEHDALNAEETLSHATRFVHNIRRWRMFRAYRTLADQLAAQRRNLIT